MTQSPCDRVNVLGVGISVLNLGKAIELIFNAVDQPSNLGFVTVTGVHGITESLSDPSLQQIHNKSFLSTPDGMPTVWAGQIKGYTHMSRVYGPDLMLKITEKSNTTGHRHFYFGGNTGVAEKLKTTLHKTYQSLNVVATYTPPFRPLNENEEEELLKQIIKHQPHFFWVGLSTPKQEHFMHDFLSKHEARLKEELNQGFLMLGVGAAFDFHSGEVAQAPTWMQNSGLEWLFRVMQEPKRLFMRYLKGNSKFLWNVFLASTGFKRFPLHK